MLISNQINTVLGAVTVVADDKKLYFLAFNDQKNLDKKLRSFKQEIVDGENTIINSISVELADYFSGKLSVFKTPIHFEGTAFQQSVWQALIKIPFGETRSYLDLAKMIQQPTAFRAVALANAANNLSIIVPCHRVINHNGAIGGYAGGIERKRWLLAHEKKLL